MEDYKEKIKELFLRYYRNIGEEEEKTYLSTKRILEMVGGVIPSKPISEHDIYECMTDMGFYQELEITYGQVCIFEGNKEKGIPAEYDRVEVDRVFKWVVFEKKHGV